MAINSTINPAHWTIADPAKFAESIKKLQQRIDSLSTKANEQIAKLGTSPNHNPDELTQILKLRDDIETLRKLAEDFVKSIEKVTANSGQDQADRDNYRDKFNRMIDHLVAMDGFNKDGDLNKVTGPTLFWSKVHQDFAGLIAMGKDGKTLESTLPGYLFDGLSFGIPWSNDDSSPLKQFWVRMSREIASAVKGDHAELHALGHVVPSSAFVTDEWHVMKEQIEKGVIKSLLAHIYTPKDTAKRDIYLMDALPADKVKSKYAQQYIFVKEPPGLHYVKKNGEITTIPLEQEDKDRLRHMFSTAKSNDAIPIAKRDDLNDATKGAVAHFLQEGKNHQGVPYAHKEGVSLKKPVQFEVKTQEDLDKLIGKDVHEDPVYKAIQQKWQDKVRRGTLITEKIKQTSNILKDGINEIEMALKEGKIQDKSKLEEQLKQLTKVSNDLFELQKHLIKNEKRMEEDLAKLTGLLEKLSHPEQLDAAEQQSLEQQLESVSNHLIQLEDSYDNDLNTELGNISRQLGDFENILQTLNQERESLLTQISERPLAISGYLPESSHQEHKKMQLRNSYDSLANALSGILQKLSSVGILQEHHVKAEELILQTKQASIMGNYKKHVTLDDVSIDMEACKNKLTTNEMTTLKDMRDNNLQLSEQSRDQIIKSLTDAKNYLTKAFQAQNLARMPISDFNQLNAILVCLDELKRENKKNPPDTQKFLQQLYSLQHLTAEIQKTNPRMKTESASMPSPTQVSTERSWGSGFFSRMSWSATKPTQSTGANFNRAEVNTDDMVNRAVRQAISTAEQPLMDHRKEKSLSGEIEFRPSPMQKR